MCVTGILVFPQMRATNEMTRGDHRMTWFIFLTSQADVAWTNGGLRVCVWNEVIKRWDGFPKHIKKPNSNFLFKAAKMIVTLLLFFFFTTLALLFTNLEKGTLAFYWYSKNLKIFVENMSKRMESLTVFKIDFNIISLCELCSYMHTLSTLLWS